VLGAPILGATRRRTRYTELTRASASCVYTGVSLLYTAVAIPTLYSTPWAQVHGPSERALLHWKHLAQTDSST
jgi:hypothetical protein